MNQHLLTSIADELNDSGRNYTVFLRQYEVSVKRHDDSTTYIRAALGKSVVVKLINGVDGSYMLDEVKSAITYRGTTGAGPARATLSSLAFANHLAEMLSELAAIATEARLVEQFWLSEGHPAYPVFWDFAFLFKLPEKVEILIGSTSD